jgi:hypothetical protein
MMVSESQVVPKKFCLSSVFDRLIKTHISLRLGDGSSLGALWELLGSSLGALWELITVSSICIINCKFYLKQSLDAKPYQKHVGVMITSNMIEVHTIVLQLSMVL